MEKFMLIFHSDTTAPKGSPEEMQGQMGKWMAWVEKLTKEGRYVSGEPLLPGGKLVSGKNKTITDGPYTEGKELVGGYFVINAENIDEAAKIATDCPDFNYGAKVQVRPIMKM